MLKAHVLMSRCKQKDKILTHPFSFPGAKTGGCGLLALPVAGHQDWAAKIAEAEAKVQARALAKAGPSESHGAAQRNGGNPGLEVAAQPPEASFFPCSACLFALFVFWGWGWGRLVASTVALNEGGPWAQKGGCRMPRRGKPVRWLRAKL